MRLLTLLLLIPLASSGCHMFGGARSVTAECEPCAVECQSCEPTDCCRWPAPLCPGRHSKYFRWWDNHTTKHHARSRARAELKECEGPRTCDYRLGYEQAFVDVSLGSKGVVPALPPQHYWREWARTPEGHARTQHWFNGYAAGAARAKAVYEPYNTVLPSQSGLCEPIPYPAYGHGGFGPSY